MMGGNLMFLVTISYKILLLFKIERIKRTFDSFYIEKIKKKQAIYKLTTL